MPNLDELSDETDIDQLRAYEASIAVPKPKKKGEVTKRIIVGAFILTMYILTYYAGTFYQALFVIYL